MRKHHPQNERIKRQYFGYLEAAKHMSAATIDQVAAAIALFEASTNHRDFRRFHIDQARKFVRMQNEAINQETGRPLAKATIYARLAALKAFFSWLAGQPGYKSKMNYSDAEYFSQSANDSRIAKAVRERPVPGIEQIRHVLSVMPTDTDIERRDRALIAFTLLSGARDDAIASMSLKHIDLEKRTVFQDAREVRTKNRKTFTSDFFPVGDDVETIFADWVTFLKAEKVFGPEDPLFPKTKVAVDANGCFGPCGLERERWSNAGPIRAIFRKAFALAGMDYFHPHSFRKTLVQLGESKCQSMASIASWSRNLGHESVATTLNSYCVVSRDEQAALFASMRSAPMTVDDEDGIMRQALEIMSRRLS